MWAGGTIDSKAIHVHINSGNFCICHVPDTGDSVRNKTDAVLDLQEFESSEKDKNHIDKFLITDYYEGKTHGAVKVAYHVLGREKRLS